MTATSRNITTFFRALQQLGGAIISAVPAGLKQCPCSEAVGCKAYLQGSKVQFMRAAPHFGQGSHVCHSAATNISSHYLQGGEALITGNTVVLSGRCCLGQSMQQMLWSRQHKCKLDLTMTCPKGQPNVF